jgi:hypothetical protein
MALGASSRSRLFLGTSDGGRVAEVAGQRRCKQFDNDDAASGVWIAVQTWLVGL